jgi:hypothetical protein
MGMVKVDWETGTEESNKRQAAETMAIAALDLSEKGFSWASRQLSRYAETMVAPDSGIEAWMGIAFLQELEVRCGLRGN